MKTKITITLMALAVLLSTNVFAAVIYVPEDKPTIQDALNEASDGDTVMVAAEIYTTGSGSGLDFGGKNISILTHKSLIKSMAGQDGDKFDFPGDVQFENSTINRFESDSAVEGLIYLFDGSGLPEDQGWLSYTNGYGGDPDRPSPVIITQTGGGPNDVFSASTSAMTFNEYMIDSGSGSFYVSMRVAIEEASHDMHDAGFAFSPIGRSYPITGTGGNNFVWSDRFLGLYINDDQIGFQDNSGVYYLDATDYHEYAVLYTHDSMKIYVDTPYEQIIQGNATPVLSREIPSLHPHQDQHGGMSYGWDSLIEGAIVFGDTTNDDGINSTYTLDYIKFEYLGPRIYPRQGTIGTEFYITGKDFGIRKGNVIMGASACKVLEWKNTSIHCVLKPSGSVQPGTFDVTIEPPHQDKIMMERAVTLMVPMIGAGQFEGYPDQDITIEGWFFGTHRGKVYIGDKQCQINSWTMDSVTGISEIIFTIDRHLSPGVYDLTITYKVAAENVLEGFIIR